MVKTLRAFPGRRIALGVLALLLLLGAAIYVVPVLPFVPRSVADLKFSVIDTVGEPLVCTGWGSPNPRFNPYGEYPRMLSDAPTYTAIIRRERLAPIPLTNDQTVAVYRDWLKLNAVRLSWDGSAYDFAMFPGPTPSEALRNEMVGKIDVMGHVYDVHQSSAMGACPICLAAGAVISTPSGPIPVSKIAVGMHVWSAAADGRLVDAVVLETTSRLAAPGSELIHVVLADGRQVTASPPHEIADGRPLGSLRVGDEIQGVAIKQLDAVDDSFGFTYDLLPSGATGEYWADGILMRTTLNTAD
jgi:hypothetical protein